MNKIKDVWDRMSYVNKMIAIEIIIAGVTCGLGIAIFFLTR